MSLALLGLLVGLGTSACGHESENTRDRLRAALRRTERLAHKFIYDETHLGKDRAQKTTVRGLIEDDFRYKARVALDGRPVLDERASDDALAVRLLDPARLDDFARKPKKKTGGDGTQPEAPGPAQPDAGPDPVAALRSRRWVLDKAGAPSLFGSGPADERDLGEDPILDALGVFAYVDRAIDEASRIVEFNEESLDPAYKKGENPFDKPKGKGVIRYDFAAPKLPKAADKSAGGNQVTPDTRHFRKMAVYVKDGRVVQIREVIDVESRLDDLEKIYDTNFPDDRAPAEVALIAVEALNAIRTGQGDDPIRLRTMSYKLDDLGKRIEVALPTDAVEASLAVLQNRGRPADAAAGAALAATVRSTSFTAAIPG